MNTTKRVLKVPVIILPTHKRNGEDSKKVTDEEYVRLGGRECSQVDGGGPEMVFGDERFSSMEIRTPLEGIYVEAAFLKEAYLSHTGKKNFKHALESLYKLDTSLVLPLRKKIK